MLVAGFCSFFCWWFIVSQTCQMTITMMKVNIVRVRETPASERQPYRCHTWRRNSHFRPRQRHRLAFMTPFCYWLLLFSGDIESNPGPAKFPCGICRRPVRENQAGVQCDLCDYWVHKRCVNMPNYECE